jgi:hypothetical protein
VTGLACNRRLGGRAGHNSPLQVVEPYDRYIAGCCSQYPFHGLCDAWLYACQGCHQQIFSDAEEQHIGKPAWHGMHCSCVQLQAVQDVHASH